MAELGVVVAEVGGGGLAGGCAGELEEGGAFVHGFGTG